MIRAAAGADDAFPARGVGVVFRVSRIVTPLRPSTYRRVTVAMPDSRCRKLRRRPLRRQQGCRRAAHAGDGVAQLAEPSGSSRRTRRRGRAAGTPRPTSSPAMTHGDFARIAPRARWFVWIVASVVTSPQPRSSASARRTGSRCRRHPAARMARTSPHPLLRAGDVDAETRFRLEPQRVGHAPPPASRASPSRRCPRSSLLKIVTVVTAAPADSCSSVFCFPDFAEHGGRAGRRPRRPRPRRRSRRAPPRLSATWRCARWSCATMTTFRPSTAGTARKAASHGERDHHRLVRRSRPVGPRSHGAPFTDSRIVVAEVPEEDSVSGQRARIVVFVERAGRVRHEIGEVRQNAAVELFGHGATGFDARQDELRCIQHLHRQPASHLHLARIDAVSVPDAACRPIAHAVGTGRAGHALVGRRLTEYLHR